MRLLAFIVILLTLFYLSLTIKKEKLIGNIESDKSLSLSTNNNIIKNAEIEIDNLDLKGRTTETTRYKIYSKKALKLTNGKYHFYDLNAEIYYNNDKFYLNSKKGFFNQDNTSILLEDNITGDFFGYRFYGELLELSIDDKKLKSDKKAILEDNSKLIISNKFETIGENEIQFKGNVRAIINFSD